MGKSKGDRDLPDMPTNAEAYVRGFYVGFASWKLSIFGGGEPVDIDRSAYFHVGYISGWVLKLLLVIWFAQQVVPPVDRVVQPVAGGIAVAGSSILAYCLTKLKLTVFFG